MKRPELLAPAGNFACAKAAFDHGADAIYCGLESFNLRAHAANFRVEDLPTLLELVHERSGRLLVALNTMPDSKQLAAMEALLKRLSDQNTLPHAFIISDPGVLLLCREVIPQVPLHLSTQTGTFNSRSLQFWKDQGIKRVVLPREMALAEIAEMSATNLLETEIFVHGAMCVSISGRCLLGAYLGGRHPNRGDCPQPCRWQYNITPAAVGAQDTTQFTDGGLRVEESEQGVYLLNSRDLCTIEILPEIIRSGVTALKIEGRNKSEHYVAAVVKTYRAAIDAWYADPDGYKVDPAWVALLASIDHRPYTTGFYRKEMVMQEVFSSKASSEIRVVGVVKAMLPGGLPVVDVKNRFVAAEELSVLPVNQSKLPFSLVVEKITDLSGNLLPYAPSSRLVVVHTVAQLRPGDMLRKTN